MSIDPTRSSDIRARGAEKAAELAENQRKQTDRPDRRDQVQISDEARALAEQGGVDRIPVTEARLAEIQARLDSGYYDRPDVVRQIAERIAESGDL